jgi:hypothetical protein
MSRLPKRLASIELTASSVSQYTSPDNTRTQIAACSVSNKTGTPRWVTVTITPSGGSAQNLVYRVTIPINQSVTLFPVVGMVLEPGDQISAQAEVVSALDFNMAGFQSTV